MQCPQPRLVWLRLRWHTHSTSSRSDVILPLLFPSNSNGSPQTKMQVRQENHYDKFSTTVRAIWRVSCNSSIIYNCLTIDNWCSIEVSLDTLMAWVFGCPEKCSVRPSYGRYMKVFFCFRERDLARMSKSFPTSSYIAIWFETRHLESQWYTVVNLDYDVYNLMSGEQCSESCTYMALLALTLRKSADSTIHNFHYGHYTYYLRLFIAHAQWADELVRLRNHSDRISISAVYWPVLESCRGDELDKNPRDWRHLPKA